ncbi:MAG: N-acetyltransferase family protein [Chitinophagales bacterium]
MMTIRDFQLPDAQAVAEIYNQHTMSYTATMDAVIRTTEDIEGWYHKFGERELMKVGEVDGEIVGWGVIKKYSDRVGYRTSCETAVYFKNSATGKGYGTQMKKVLIEVCKELKYRHLVAKIWAANTASIEYNRKQGYEIVGTQKEVGYLNGKWIDVTIMQLVLRDVPPVDDKF